MALPTSTPTQPLHYFVPPSPLVLQDNILQGLQLSLSDEEDEGFSYFSKRSVEEVIESETSEEDSENEVLILLSGVVVGDSNDVRVAYQDSTWSKLHSTYDPKPIPFTKENVGLIEDYESVSTYLVLFSLFWPVDLLRDIAYETNRYARSVDNDGRTWERRGWYPVTYKELQIFLAVVLYMGMKQLPNMHSFWEKATKYFIAP